MVLDGCTSGQMLKLCHGFDLMRTKKEQELRDRIFDKYGGLCAYSGTKLEDDWQVEHIVPVRRNNDGTLLCPENDVEENMIPVQRILNHYKHSLDLETFRTWYLCGLHLRLAKLPKNPQVAKSIKRKDYLLKVASYFKITPENPFPGKFYFEEVGSGLK